MPRLRTLSRDEWPSYCAKTVLRNAIIESNRKRDGMSFLRNFPHPQPPTRAQISCFWILPRRKYMGLLDHQGQMLRTYSEKGESRSDVALQLPTGSGKTLYEPVHCRVEAPPVQRTRGVPMPTASW